MPRQDRAVRTRSKIIEAAAELIHEVGYAEMTLNQVSQRAEVTKGGMYFHFASKEDIGLALIELQHAQVRGGAAAILDSDEDAVVKMLRMSADLAARLASDPVVRAGIRLTTDSVPLGPTRQEPYKDWISVYEQLITEAVAAGQMKPMTEPHTLAQTVIACYTGIQLVSETFTSRSDLLSRLVAFWDLIFQATVPDIDLRKRCQQLRETHG